MLISEAKEVGKNLFLARSDAKFGDCLGAVLCLKKSERQDRITWRKEVYARRLKC